MERSVPASGALGRVVTSPLCVMSDECPRFRAPDAPTGSAKEAAEGERLVGTVLSVHFEPESMEPGVSKPNIQCIISIKSVPRDDGKERCSFREWRFGERSGNLWLPPRVSESGCDASESRFVLPWVLDWVNNGDALEEGRDFKGTIALPRVLDPKNLWLDDSEAQPE